MKVVGINRIHNSAVTYLENGELKFHLENERLSNIKYDSYPFLTLNKLKTYTKDINSLAIAGCNNLKTFEDFTSSDVYSEYVQGLNKSFLDKGFDVRDYGMDHHFLHAAHAFYNSGFDTALCVVKDGMGSEYPITDSNFKSGSYGREISSVFEGSYPDTFYQVEREVYVPFDCDYTSDNVTYTNTISEGLAFQKTAKHFGFHELDAGKVMGMASYGKSDPNVPPIYVDNKINPTLFNNELSTTKEVTLNIKNYPYLDTDDFQIQANFARALQEATQHKVLNDIIRLVEKTGHNNVCLSGGYFLNCVANYYYKKRLPKNINLYIEPISSDAGTSFGAAKYLHHTSTKDTTKRPLKTLYTGLQYTLTLDDIQTTTYENTDAKTVANLIADGNIVAMYQGRSEGGPRALGNRSILFDPRNPNGKDIVNTVKNREWFRPFAGTILLEKVNDWFDMAGLDESPYMMYAVDTLKNKIDSIPAINHIDNTCRVQTLTQKQNPNFYKLIQEFESITQVPILFNTSFNLAGDCIVETIQDAIDTVQKSKIDYLYVPELGVLIK
jgi:carbamoyltransferase|tara:strand:- start:6234 stop:7895 length:1662 start_codon:yes stop_codon:yes gene_type:complete